MDEDHKDEDDGEDNEDDSDVDSEDNATSSPMTSNKKRKYNAVQVMITPGDDDMKANSNMVKSYPYLSQALGGEDGFDPTNPSVKRSMRELLKELNKLLSTEYQLDVNGISNNKISYSECLGPKVIPLFSTQKNGSTQQSKSPDQTKHI